MRKTYAIEVVNGISLAPLTRDSIRNIRKVVSLQGHYSFAWSMSNPEYALLCDLEFQKNGESETSMGISLAPWQGGTCNSSLQLECFFDGVLHDNKRTKTGNFNWMAGSSEPSVCKELLSHPFTISETRYFDNAAACELGLPAKMDTVKWSLTVSPESPLAAVGRCHSWESWNPVEFWDTELRQQLHVIKDEKTTSAATPNYGISFNINGSLLYINNGYVSTCEIWGIVEDTFDDSMGNGG